MSKYHSEWLPGEQPPMDVPDAFGRMPGEVRLPQPSELHNASGIPVSDRALAILLYGTRAAEVLDPCLAPDCEACNELRLIWWDCCNALSRTVRILLQAQLRADGYGLPDAPWEDIAAQGVVPPGDNAEPGL